MKYRSGDYRFDILIVTPPRYPAALKRAVLAAARGALEGLPKKVRKEKLVPERTYVLSLAVVGKKEMHRLNKGYRGKDKPTDVLSFSRLEGEPFPTPVAEAGDVIICHDVALAQARDYGAPLAEELQRLLVHGILHVFGYDHELGPTEARRQFGLENRILKQLRPTRG